MNNKVLQQNIYHATLTCTIPIKLYILASVFSFVLVLQIVCDVVTHDSGNIYACGFFVCSK